jgi:hypothetical protein
VDAEEIDLGLRDLLAVDVEMHWNAGDESEKFVLFAASDTKEPVFVVAWWGKGPLEEFD